MTTERTYMVMGINDDGDSDLFATDNIGRAEAQYERMLRTHVDVQANWDREADRSA